MLRLMLLMPARAIGDTQLTVAETWDRTRGNTWRLFWGLIACLMPPLIPALFLELAIIGAPSPGKAGIVEFLNRVAIAHPIFLGYYLLMMPICIGFMSLAYQHFFSRSRMR